MFASSQNPGDMPARFMKSSNDESDNVEVDNPVTAFAADLAAVKRLSGKFTSACPKEENV